MRFDIGMPECRTYFGRYKMLRVLSQLAFISAITNLRLACSSVLLGAGNISSPNYPQNYPNDAFFTWTLIATEGRLVSLQITDFQLEYGYDFVQIYKDTKTTAPLYKFTGSIHGNGERLILSSKIEIWFSSDASYSDSGFRMEFESVNATYSTACGGKVHQSGNITSPNYPQQYPNSSYCTWTLTPTSGRSISLRLISLDVESGFDYLRIYNGSILTNQHLTHNLTGFNSTDRKPVIYGDSATIVFTSDNSYSRRGFLIEFESVEINSYTECGGELNGSGIITTPNYPHNYPNNTYCVWKITAAEDQDVYMRLLEFNTELNYDFLKVFLRIQQYPQIYRYGWYSGRQSNTLFPVESGRISELIFESDSTYSDSGFRLEFNTVRTKCPTVSFCGGDLQGSGNITFSESECSRATCTWRLTANPDHVISIQIADMSTDDGYLYIFNETQLTESYSFFSCTGTNWKTAKPILLGPRCLVTFERTLASTFLKLEFKSVPRSFHAACGGEFIGSGRITSLNIPDNDPYNYHCIWELTALADHAISLRIAGFNFMQASLYVFDGSVPVRSYLLYPYSSSHSMNQKLLLPGPKTIVVLYGNFTTLTSDMELLFESVNPNMYTACGGVMNGSGEIASPNYPNNYPNNCRCTWRLSATAGLSVALRIIAIKTETNYDYIQVFNGTGINGSYSELFRKFPFNPSGKYRQLYPNYVKDSSGEAFWLWPKSDDPFAFWSNVVVTFTSDSTISRSGFRMEFTSINTTTNTDCGGELQGSGIITSPNYPRHYSNYSQCTWRLRATSDGALLLRFLDFSTEPYHDYLFVAASSYLLWEEGVEYFTGMKPIEYKRKPLYLGLEGKVIFWSDLTNSDTGFKLEFITANVTPFTDCGKKLYGSGDLISPNYPHDYNNQSSCIWKLTAEAGRSVLLHILEFNTEDHDYVTIYNVTNTTRLYAYRFSGSYNTTTKIMKVLVHGTYAAVLFKSDISISDMGFRMQFRSADVTEYTGCGGELRGSGNITSPNYPANYPNNSRCAWTILADSGHVVSLRLIKFNTEYGYDVVSIYNGSVTLQKYSSYNYTGYFGERVEPITLGTSVALVFTSDISESASGFVIEFTSVYPANKSGNTTRMPCRRRTG